MIFNKMISRTVPCFVSCIVAAAVVFSASVSSADDPFPLSDEDLEQIMELKKMGDEFAAEHGFPREDQDGKTSLLEMFEQVYKQRKARRQPSFADAVDQLDEGCQAVVDDVTQDPRLEPIRVRRTLASDPPADPPRDRTSRAESLAAYLQGDQLYNNGYPDEAEYFIDRSLKWNPENVDALCLKGILQYDKGDYGPATIYYDWALKVEPKPVIYNNRGNAFMELGRYEEAERDFQTALRLDPNLVVAHCNSGILYLHLDEPEKALGYLTRALELNPEFTYASCFHAACLAELGKMDQAIHQLRQILAQYPGCEPANEFLQAILEGNDLFAATTSAADDGFGQ
jgi:tetratricopeptide (TPR) repeat protein